MTRETSDTSRSLTRQSLLVAGVCVVTDTGLLLIDSYSCGRWQSWTALALIVLIDAALATPARLSGVVALLHGLACLVTPFLFTNAPGVTWQVTEAGLMVAGYRAGAWLRSPQALAALAALAAGLTGNYLLTSHHFIFVAGLPALSGLLIEIVGKALLPWLVGRYTTARRAHIAELERQAELRRHSEQAAVQRAVAEERSAIARDLHDMISHHVSAIGMHAGAARLGLGSFPNGTFPNGTTSKNAVSKNAVSNGTAHDGAPLDGGVADGGVADGGVTDSGVHRSLAAVESSSRSAMADLRRLLDILHGDDTDTARRQPGLNNLDELLDGVRAAGTTITLTTHGLPRELPGSLDVALYRIVQEALTNALRHGRGESVGVELEYRETEAVVTVTNQLAEQSWHGERRNSPHRGLAGIRQRVALFGGRITYGVQPDGRHWRVQVSFPLERPCS
ncbi:sensor histidine kinase [Streptosporangium carneum]|uniref:histidine kinase n=1 Tax=Streptosporangium carneum TaxID=47481 RepID=A0A9W6I629_9ACTN|nr:histidine kinase [Streptosporangium carneum]GLK11879.1 two-component sensor histidine kinase [Streptosporangium carneum]